MQLTIEGPRVVLMLYSHSGPCQNISYSFIPSLSFSTCCDFFNCNIKGSQCKLKNFSPSALIVMIAACADLEEGVRGDPDPPPPQKKC